jgi:hypothetical protein
VRYIDVNLILCTDDTTKPLNSCKTVNETLDLLRSQKLYLNTLNMKFYSDSKNINPVNLYLSYSYLMLDINYFKKQNAYIKQGIFNSDDGALLKDVKTSSSFALDNWSFDQINNNQYNKIIIQTRIYFTRTVEIYDRSFKKLQSFSATLITTVNIFSLSFKLISNYFNDIILTNKLITQLLDFKSYEFTYNKLLGKSEVRKTFMNNFTNGESIPYNRSRVKSSDCIYYKNNNFVCYNIELNMGSKRTIRFRPEHKMLLYQKPPNFKFPGYMMLNYIFCRWFMRRKEMKHYKLFEKGRKLIEKSSDIITLFFNINLINDLKSILFNNFHQICLNFMKKGLIDQPNIKNEVVMQKIQIVEYFHKNRPNLSRLDKIILEKLDSDLKLIIDSVNSQNL